MSKTFCLFITLFALICAHQVRAVANEKLDYFVFLVTGKPTAGTAQEEIQKMQAAHLENFGRLAKLGELSAAGPCADPEKVVRGIVVIKASSLADAQSKFEPDPYVGQGFMKTEIHQYRAVAGKFVIPPEASQLEKNVIVILSNDAKPAKSVEAQKVVQDSLAEFAKAQHTAGKLGFAALFSEESQNRSPRMAVMIFRGEDVAEIEKSLADLAAVKDKSLRVQVFAQYLVKDSMPRE